MKLIDLLGLSLKSDAVIDIINDYDVENVVYDFDRSHENMPDAYWAPAHAAGFQLRFDETQILDTIFCYIAAKEGFSPVAPDLIGVPIHRSFDAAEAACKASGQAYSVADPAKYSKWWLRIDGAEHNVHYQFDDGRLALITLMKPR